MTHAGAMVEINRSGMAWKLFSANPNNKGSLGDSSNGDANYEYGTTLGFANDMFRAQAGYLTRPVNKASGEKNGSRSLIDVTAGVTFGPIMLDVEFASLQDQSKNTITPADSSDSEKAATGILGLLTYNFIEDWSGSFRYELAENDPALEDFKKTTSYAAVINYKYDTNIQLRAEYVNIKNTLISDPNVSWQQNRTILSGLYYF